MKNLFLVALMGTFFLGCGNPKNQNQSSNKADEVIAPDMHTSQIALDFWGIYKGVTPCADCEGIETTLELKSDETWKRQTVYLSKNDEVFIDSGTYQWNDDGRSIRLEGMDNDPLQYFVGEGYLLQLDMEGNRIEGELAEKYILKKVE